MASTLCSCGHGRSAHQHYRRGNDCAQCACLKFATHSVLRILTPRILGGPHALVARKTHSAV